MLLHSLAGRQSVEFLQAWQTVCCPHGGDTGLGDSGLLGVLLMQGGDSLSYLFGFQRMRGRSSQVFSQWHWGVDEQQWVEVTELEAEKEDFRISPCCIEMWEIVGFFKFLLGQTAAPEVKSQVSRRTHI